MHCQRVGVGWRVIALLLQLNWLAACIFAQQQQQQAPLQQQQQQQPQQLPGFSLQAAVDELHRREAAKYPLNAPPMPQRYAGPANEPEYLDDERENYETDEPFPRHSSPTSSLAAFRAAALLSSSRPANGYNELNDDVALRSYNPFGVEGKRAAASLFRERDTKLDNSPPYTAFRERANYPSLEPRTELTDQFLREIEQTNEHEHQERYKDALRHLWEQYQEQENEISEGGPEQKKRMRVPPYYMLMQKRSYPILPWLPYEKDKRFPVAKRSAKPFGETDDKVAKELSELFENPSDEKKKRSADDNASFKSTIATSAAPVSTSTATNDDDMHLEGETHAESKKSSNATTTLDGDGQKEKHQYSHVGHEGHKHRKRSDHRDHSHEYSEEFSDEEEEHEEGADDEEEHDEVEDGEEQKRKKKKRATTGNYFWPGELPSPRRKKSIDWSQYFGLNRKKKSLTASNADLDEDKKKRTINPENIESMDKRLQSIEDFIIGETVKYTGAHEGITDQDEIRKVKDHVLSRLATAYSLEKMRRSLEKLRQSVETENHLLRNVIGGDKANELLDKSELGIAAEKRLTIKKEKPEINEHDLPLIEPKFKDSKSNEEIEDNDINESKRKKKRNRLSRYPDYQNDLELGNSKSNAYESLNDAYLGNKNYLIGSEQCPLIESMAERCRGVDLLSGDLNQELLPICGVHQICYLCGTSQIKCDYQYLADADVICGTNSDCQAAARSVLMILRGSPGPHVGPRECAKNPCLFSAMREIGL